MFFPFVFTCTVGLFLVPVIVYSSCVIDEGVILVQSLERVALKAGFTHTPLTIKDKSIVSPPGLVSLASPKGYNLSVRPDGYAGEVVRFRTARLTADFRWYVRRSSPEKMIAELDTFNDVINSLPQELKLRPVKYFCGFALGTQRGAAVLLALCDRPGLYARPASLNQIWQARPILPIEWDTMPASAIAAAATAQQKIASAPRPPVELVLGTWNKEFGASTGIYFREGLTSWDQNLVTNQGICLARTADGYQLTCRDLPQASFPGLHTLLEEFPKIEKRVLPTPIAPSRETELDSDLDLG